MILKILFRVLWGIGLMFPLSGMAMESTPLEATEKSEEDLFSVGFEFQELNGLLKQGPDDKIDYSFAKKPIFSFYYNDGGKAVKLWHLEMDGHDLEFVVMPFQIPSQKKLMEIALESLQTIAEALEKKIRDLKSIKGEFLTIDQLADLINRVDQYIKDEERNKKISHTIDKILFKGKNIYRKSTTFDFVPQMTIGIDLSKIKEVSDLIYIKNPYYQRHSKEIEETIRHLSDQIKGFAFLHLLCLKDLAMSANQSISKLWIKYDSNHQGDAKSLLNIMSRRPFSEMWQEIGEGRKYSEIFDQAKRREFKDALYANYLEEIVGLQKVDSEEMNPFDYKSISDVFGKDFIKFLVGDSWKLLSQGCIPNKLVALASDKMFVDGMPQKERILEKISGMKSLREQMFDVDYIFTSVDEPQHIFRYDTKIGKISKQPHQYDWLSPPPLLDDQDSMGYYTQEMMDKKISKREMSSEQKTWLNGKAVIEFRMFDEFGHGYDLCQGSCSHIRDSGTTCPFGNKETDTRFSKLKPDVREESSTLKDECLKIINFIEVHLSKKN